MIIGKKDLKVHLLGTNVQFFEAIFVQGAVAVFQHF